MADPVTITCAGSCSLTVTHLIQLDGFTGLTPEKVGDYVALWGAFLVAAVVVLCVKAIYRRFRIDHES
jgi:hypothetical protein